MPVYNGEKYLETAIKSVLNQTYFNIQFIIINDCSTDNSDKIVNVFLSNKKIIYLSNEKNSGVAISRNNALEHATGEYIAFHDQDDLWLPNKLELQIATFRKTPELGLLHAQYARVDDEGDLLPKYKKIPQTAFGNPDAQAVVGDVFESIFISNDIQPLTSIIPRKVLDDVGWFNPDLPGVDDYELWLRIAYHYKVGQLQTIVGYWRKHDDQQSNKGYQMLMMKLKAINIFLADHRDAKDRVNSKYFTTRMHGMNRGVANYYFYNIQDYTIAKSYFTKALKFRPLDFNSLIKLFYCCLPEIFRSSIRRLKNIFK